MKRLLAQHTQHQQAVFGGAGARTAGQLVAHAEAIAERLVGPTRGADKVAIACADRYHFAAALLATWQRGLVAALPANGQLETVRELGRAEGVVALLHDRDAEGLDVRTLEAPEHSRSVRAWDFEPRATALVVFTSGSTGAPTPHLKTFAQLLDEAGMWVERFGLAGQRVVAAVPPHHIYGLLFGVLMPLLGGGSMSRRAPLQPAEIAHELESVGARVLIAVPPHLAALAAAKELTLPPLERVFSSAAPLPAATDHALAERGLRVTQVLGSTETGGIALRQSCEEPWRALPGVALEVDAEAALWVRSPWAAADPEQAVRTADRVQLLDDGAGFRHLGRTDAVVKVGGRRVDLGELEARLSAVPGVREARVISNAGESLRGAELWAVVEADDVAVETLKRALSDHVDPVALPRRFRVVRALPRGASGKVSRAALLALFDTWRLPMQELEDGRVQVAIPHNLGFFRGHFTGQPILPGVVQLEQIALRETRRRWPELGAVARVTRIKFKRLVAPGEELLLSLSRKASLQVQFALSAGDEPASSGIFHFRAAETDGVVHE